MKSTEAAEARKGNEKLEEIEVKVSEGQTVSRRKQKKSTSYALKAVRTHFETLEEDKLISSEDKVKMEEIVKKAAETFIKREYGIG